MVLTILSLPLQNVMLREVRSKKKKKSSKRLRSKKRSKNNKPKQTIKWQHCKDKTKDKHVTRFVINTRFVCGDSCNSTMFDWLLQWAQMLLTLQIQSHCQLLPHSLLRPQRQSSMQLSWLLGQWCPSCKWSRWWPCRQGQLRRWSVFRWPGGMKGCKRNLSLTKSLLIPNKHHLHQSPHFFQN